MATIVITLTSGTTWQVPRNWTNNNTIEAIGAGGSGTPGGEASAGNGGGGGAYSRVSNVVLTPLSTVNIQVGVNGGTTGTGTVPTSNTWFQNSSTLLAVGGASATSAGAGTGGSSANCVGLFKFSGGNGSIFSSSPGGPSGGAGGGAGGYSGAGGNATTTTGGTAGTGGSGGAGGNGGIYNVALGKDGGQGGLYGGGGGGGGGTTLTSGLQPGYAGAGAVGAIIITYTANQIIDIGGGITMSNGVIIGQ